MQMIQKIKNNCRPGFQQIRLDNQPSQLFFWVRFSRLANPNAEVAIKGDGETNYKNVRTGHGYAAGKQSKQIQSCYEPGKTGSHTEGYSEIIVISTFYMLNDKMIWLK